MSEKTAKLIRKQLRNVTQEQMKEAAFKELAQDVYTRVSKDVLAKLSEVDSQIRETLKGIDERSKDLQLYILRQGQQQPSENAPKIGEQAVETPAAAGE